MPKASDELPDDFLTLSQAAEEIGLSINRLREHAETGRLRSIKWRGVWYTTKKHLAEFDAAPRLVGRPKGTPASNRKSGLGKPR